MQSIDKLIARACATPRHIVLPEGEDERVITGALKAAKDGIARITLLSEAGCPEKLAHLYSPTGLPVTFINPQISGTLDQFATTYFELRKHKGVTLDEARIIITEPLSFAAMMLRENYADGSLAGAVHTTGDTVRTAIQIVGLSPQSSLVSSFFIMEMSEPFHEIKGTILFADCAMVVDPDAAQLAQIAIDTADNMSKLLGISPAVAMLSFSTNGSASHPFAYKVQEATALVRSKRPDILIEGEMQLDAAIVPEISAVKAPHSKIVGQANILVFPNLDAANIGYKIAERIGRAKAIGPVLQGLAKPANDLSRGCSSQDVYHMIAVTAAQVQSS